MYVNKFKCNNPALSDFREGVAFCSGCNKSVYDAEVIDLKDLLVTNESVCARVPIRKISWMERTVVGASFAATAMIIPLEASAQNLVESFPKIEVIDSTKIMFSGVVKNSEGIALEDVFIAVYAGGQDSRLDVTNILVDSFTNDNGEYSIQIELLDSLPKTFDLLFKHEDYTKVLLTGVSRSGLQNHNVELSDLNDTDTTVGVVRYITNCIPMINKEPTPSGMTFRREDLRNIPR